MSLEEFIDGALGQAPHLPPVGEEGEAGEEEADDVYQEQEDDEKVEIQKLRSRLKRLFRIVFTPQPAAKFSNARQYVGVRIPLKSVALFNLY